MARVIAALERRQVELLERMRCRRCGEQPVRSEALGWLCLRCLDLASSATLDADAAAYEAVTAELEDLRREPGQLLEVSDSAMLLRIHEIERELVCLRCGDRLLFDDEAARWACERHGVDHRSGALDDLFDEADALAEHLGVCLAAVRCAGEGCGVCDAARTVDLALRSANWGTLREALYGDGAGRTTAAITCSI